MNFWYAHPVGHAIEGLRYALGYHAADPGLRVSVLLNGAAPVELGNLCPFVERTYGVPFTGFCDAEGDPAAALADVPRDWDHLVDDARGHQPDQLARFAGLRRFYEAGGRHFRAGTRGLAGAEPPAYRPHQQLRLELPAHADLGPGPWIAVLPTGSSDGRAAYPSLASWQLVLRELERTLGARFCLVGKLRQDGRTASRFARDELDALLAAFPDALDAFDRPLVEQLALVEACDLFLSPHTGFGMAALAVATPWLTVGGGRWPEWFFNGVPFYSVLPPRDAWYTYFDPPAPITDERVRADLPELVEAARTLVEGGLSYEDALAGHFRRFFDRSPGTRIYSLDAIHERYL